ncbi:MAG: SipW-dependent-type signal peptide-containing protein [Archaeoglobaceae archaeon]
MRKFGAMFVVLLVALGLVGATYAVWTDQLTISGSVATGKLEVVFSSAEALQDNDPEGYDIGSVTCSISEDGKTGYVTISNAYPGYEASCVFTIANVGSIPAKVTGIEINADEGLTVETSGVYVDDVIDVEDSADLTVTVTCGEEVEEDSDYTFTVTIDFGQV